MTDEYVPKLVHLPGTKLTPEVVLHRTLNKTEHIKAVAVIILWNNDEIATDWSQMKLSEICWMERQFHEQVGRVIRGEEV